MEYHKPRLSKAIIMIQTNLMDLCSPNLQSSHALLYMANRALEIGISLGFYFFQT